MRALPLSLLLLAALAPAQDRLQTAPRYERYQKVMTDSMGAFKRPSLDILWTPEAIYFRQNGKDMTFDFKNAFLKEGVRPESTGSGNSGGGRRTQNRRNPERGRQYDRTFSPDGKLTALYKDANVWLQEGEANPMQITTLGDPAKRTKCGVASWVYGEELGVREAMWFSPDSKKLAYYYFDDSKVKDYFLTLGQTKFQSELDTEAYPKAGTDNPSVGLFLYDLESKKTIELDVRFGDPEIGHYVYSVRWSPSGEELLFNRTNRKQNTMQLCAANPTTGKCRVIVEEKGPAWVDNSPFIRWLSDNKRFLWISERNGFKNYYLGNIDGSPLKAITKLQCDVEDIVRLDEAKSALYYRAHDGDNPYKVQFHLASLDGKFDRRLTDPAYHHTITMGPATGFFTDTYESATQPPIVALRDRDGKQVFEMGRSDVSGMEKLGIKPRERFSFTAADGVTKCYGWLQKPSDFDPQRKYPLIVDVYGGPESGGGPETFALSNATCELGFLIAWIDGRGTNDRGYAFRTAVYGKLGVVEIDDQAAGVKELAKRAYVDGTKVGINGTSYGGYSSVMAILRHPEVFQAAVASSSVTDWRHYDTIYTERYMGLPWENENKAGYDAGSAMTYASQLKGRLMLFYGSADNNVHPANSLMLAQALNRANKGYDMMVGPDQGHTGLGFRREWEYFFDALMPVLRR